MSRIGKVTAGLAAAVLVLAFTTSCGSKKENAAPAAASVAKVEMTTCYNCHSDAKNPPGLAIAFGDSTTTAYNGKTIGLVNSRHFNPNSSPAFTDASWSTSCGSCHDSVDDGTRILSYYLDTGLTVFGTANRPIVSCESCHGGGANHYGVGPLEYNKPGADQCATCHNDSVSHAENFPEAVSIKDDHAAGRHASSMNSNVFVTGSTTDVRARCSRCHTHEGAKRYLGTVTGTEGHDALQTALDAQPDIANASSITCATCHDPHNTSIQLGEKSSLTSGSMQYRTCTSCHQLFDASGNLMADSYHDPRVNQYGGYSEVITDTHYDDPVTQEIEGYVLNINAAHSFSSGNTNNGACMDCHNQHNADATLHRQWATSKHGGQIETVKTTLGATVGVDDNYGVAWAHYDFKASNRQSCQRCHTATGARNYFNNMATYSAANNTFVATGNQKEMLYCWACHTDNKGTLRNPGVYTSDYTGAPYTFPDLKGSNMCISCHSGRESGDSIKALSSGFNNRSFVNSHYLTGGGTVFTSTGYEYGGLDYANKSFYQHDQIGLTTTFGGSNGPCVGCHMTSSEPHRFLPVTVTNGVITAIVTDVCTNCHSGQYSMTATELETQREELAASLEALKAQLAAAGYNYTTSYPYFSTRNWLSSGDTDNTGAITGKNNMGAAFNYNLLVHDPGAYAHNRYYAKRLIYDSIDWLDDNSLNDSVSATLAGATHSGASYQALAQAYILVNGGRP